MTNQANETDFRFRQIDISTSPGNPQPPGGEIKWDYTGGIPVVTDKLRNIARPVIGRDTDIINGGIWLIESGARQEGIIIDDKLQPELVAIYHKLLVEYVFGNPSYKTSILSGIKDIAKYYIPYDSTKERQVYQQSLTGHTRLVDFVNHGGQCDEQAALAAYLGEKAVERGYITGRWFLRRNRIVDTQGSHIEGHAWALYVSRNGDKFVIDPASDFTSRIEDAQLYSDWPYDEPESTVQAPSTRQNIIIKGLNILARNRVR